LNVELKNILIIQHLAYNIQNKEFRLCVKKISLR
jgi:hypothetical protein